MKLRVVEVKGNDLYVLYDVDGGGVCCCSKYTINQLMNEYKQKIEGVRVTEKGIEIRELSLDGKVRTKKAPVICEDETKRSAVTIMKGLDEQHYPRVKQERKGKSNIVKLTYVTLNQKKLIDKGMAIQYDNDTYILDCDDASRVSRSAHPEMKIEKYAATEEEIKYMERMKARVEEKERMRLGIVKRNEEIAKQRDLLIKQVEELNAQIAELNTQIDGLNKKFNTEFDIYAKDVKEIYLEHKYANITGEEKVRYSFASRTIENTIKAEAVPTFLKRTKRQILYTHGLAYRNPAIHNKPVTVEEVLKIISENSWYDLDARNDKYIYINTYSGNDMY